ncbi:hypothetical protein BZA05DRAFT_415697 [Tricharina praecox]|uniref:uncharacterized protein n=1 Tax=Tricharina praecox TaxID=43433 RepID=UPI00221FCDAC|nr:uncharacterized protein BZA05DRAFT_415697 [Tricharina praecox]KAI5856984.1 hypothetical protein BZA05DRAFT_415697 [Tricharina praecox]
MSTSSFEPYRPHSVRTATHARSPALLPATITAIHTPTPHLRQITLALASPLVFKPGQWIDLHLPSIRQPGGFTIITPPSRESTSFELSIGHAPQNTAAAWLWREPAETLRQEVEVRVGGEFVFPPAGVRREDVERVVFVAGGVGVNPFLSMIAWVRGKEAPKEWENVEMKFLWSGRKGQWAYLDRIERACGRESVELFETGEVVGETTDLKGWEVNTRRLNVKDLERAVDGKKVLAFVCGPKGFTDFCVDALVRDVAVQKERVFCEKWW